MSKIATHQPKKDRPAPKPKPKKAFVQARRHNYPWDEMESLFVHGEEVKDGNGKAYRDWPTTGDIATRYGATSSTVSSRATKGDATGKTWHEKRENFQIRLSNERDKKLAEEIAGQEVAFRGLTLQAAQRIVRHVDAQLSRGIIIDADGRFRSSLPADTITKLAGALKRAQETGLVSMDRPANGPGEDPGDDWSALRRLRQGSLLPGQKEGA